FTHPAKKATFTGLNVGRSLDFRGTTFAGSVDFSSLKVEGEAVFQSVVFAGEVDLRYSRFLTLNPFDVSQFTTIHTLLLVGLTYQDITGKDSIKEKWKDLLSLANKARYNSSVYLNLETFLQQHGYSKEADDVFVARKQREREDMWSGLFPSFAWWS